jgi:hypothetical protein
MQQPLFSDKLRYAFDNYMSKGTIALILGWSEQIFTIISELVVAHANQANPCIVILGNASHVCQRRPHYRNRRRIIFSIF